MEESHKTHRPHIKVGKDEEKKEKKKSVGCMTAWGIAGIGHANGRADAIHGLAT